MVFDRLQRYPITAAWVLIVLYVALIVGAAL